MSSKYLLAIVTTIITSPRAMPFRALELVLVALALLATVGT
jgi:hypothetical protein